MAHLRDLEDAASRPDPHEVGGVVQRSKGAGLFDSLLNSAVYEGRCAEGATMDNTMPNALDVCGVTDEPASRVCEELEDPLEPLLMGLEIIIDAHLVLIISPTYLRSNRGQCRIFLSKGLRWGNWRP